LQQERERCGDDPESVHIDADGGLMAKPRKEFISGKRGGLVNHDLVHERRTPGSREGEPDSGSGDHYQASDPGATKMAARCRLGC
jgi:hypothetical protein